MAAMCSGIPAQGGDVLSYLFSSAIHRQGEPLKQKINPADWPDDEATDDDAE